MKFEETSKDFFEIPKELMGDCYVYFLLEDDEVVYVGQTTNGMYRPFSHKDKKFNRVIAVPCEERNLNHMERNFIIKYSPKYNLSLPSRKTSSLHAFKKDVQEFFGLNASTSELYDILREKGLCPHRFHGEDYLLTSEWLSALEIISESINENETNG